MYFKMKRLLYFVVIAVALLVQSSIGFGQYDTGGNFTEIIYVGDLNSSLLIDEIQKSISNKKLNANVIIEKPENKAVGYSSDEVYYYDLMWEYQIKADSLYKKGLFGDYRKKTLGYYVPIATGIIETIQLTDSEKNEFDYNKYSIGNLKYKAVTSTTSIGYGRNQKEVNLTHDEFSFSVYKNSKYLKTINDKVLTSQKEFIELIDNVDRSTEINRDRFKNSNSENSSGSNYLNTGISNGGRSIYDINGTNALAISALKLETFDFYYDNITYRSAEVVRQLEKKNKVGGKSVEVNTIVLDSLLDKFSSNNERILIINTENQKYVEFLTKEFFNKAKEKNISIIFVIPQNLKNTSAINNYNGFTVNNTYKDKHLMTVEQSVGSYSNVYVFDRSKLSTETTKAISLIKNIKAIKNIDMYRVDRSKSWLEGGYYNVKLANPIPSNSKIIVEEHNKVIYEGVEDNFKLPLNNVYNRYTFYLMFDGILKQRVEEEYIYNSVEVSNDIYIKYDKIRLNSKLKDGIGDAYIDRRVLVDGKELLNEKGIKLSNEIYLDINQIISKTGELSTRKISVETILYFKNEIYKIPIKEYNIVKSDENVFDDVKIFRNMNDLIFDYSVNKDDQILNLIIDGTIYDINSFTRKISNVNNNSDIYIRSIKVLDNSIVIYEKKIEEVQEITGNLGKNIIVDKDGKVELSLCNLNEMVSNYEVYYGSVKVYEGKGEKVEFVLDKPEYNNDYKSDYIKLFTVDHKGSKYLLDQEYLKMSFWSTPSVKLENGELICDIKSLNGYDGIPYELFDNDEKVINGITNNGFIKIDFDENIITNKKQKDYRVRYSFNSGRVKYYVDRKLCSIKFTSGGVDKVINSKSVFGISDGVKVNYICSPQDYFAFESYSQINNIKLAAFSKSDDKWINMKLTGKTVVELNGTSIDHLLYAYKIMGDDIDFVCDLKPDIIDQHLIINDLVVNNNKLTFTVNVSNNMNKQYKIFNNNELVYYGLTPNQSIDLKEGENVISGEMVLKNGIKFDLGSFKVYGSSNVISTLSYDMPNIKANIAIKNSINESLLWNYSIFIGPEKLIDNSTKESSVDYIYDINKLMNQGTSLSKNIAIKGYYMLNNVKYHFNQQVLDLNSSNSSIPNVQSASSILDHGNLVVNYDINSLVNGLANVVGDKIVEIKFGKNNYYQKNNGPFTCFGQSYEPLTQLRLISLSANSISVSNWSTISTVEKRDTVSSTQFLYKYDSSGRLVKVTDGYGNSIAEYIYDLNGNLIKIVKK